MGKNNKSPATQCFQSVAAVLTANAGTMGVGDDAPVLAQKLGNPEGVTVTTAQLASGMIMLEAASNGPGAITPDCVGLATTVLASPAKAPPPKTGPQ